MTRQPETSTSISTETILVVDDNEMDRKLMSIALSEQGYRVLEAKDGNEGLRVFQDCMGKIDLILTDILMPGMDGVEFIERVRLLSRKVKVLFISGFERKFSHEIGGESVEFIEKSHDPSQLIRRVRDILDEGSSVLKWFRKVVTRHNAMATE